MEWQGTSAFTASASPGEAHFTCFCKTGGTCFKAGMNCKYMPYSSDKPAAVQIVVTEKATINKKSNKVNKNFITVLLVWNLKQIKNIVITLNSYHMKLHQLTTLYWLHCPWMNMKASKYKYAHKTEKLKDELLPQMIHF